MTYCATTMAGEDRLLHQFVHGYARGHRLLAFSTPPSENIASVINRASDAAPNFRPSHGSYLTGYGLPDGSWALARTWPALEAERPNTVRTHTIVVPPQLVGRVSAAAIAAQLREPVHDGTLQSFRVPIPVDALPDTRGTTTRLAAAAGVAIYHRDSVTVAGLATDERESLAVALWDQQWMPLRRGFNFCTAPDASFFEERTRVLTFAGRQPANAEPNGDTPPIVTLDLCQRTPFREWLHFVGSGERDYSLVTTFAELYLLIEASSTNDSADAIDRVETVLAGAGADPGELRRLKRRLLSFRDDRPRWIVDPVTLLDAIAHRPLGTMTLAEDASLEAWVAYAWQTDPVGTSAVLTNARAQPNVEPGEAKARLATHGVSAAFDGAIERLVTPATVGTAADIAPQHVVNIMVGRGDSVLWRAWSQLPGPTRRRTLDEPVRGDGASWLPVAVEGVRGEPDALRDLLDVYPEAVDDLVERLASQPVSSDVDLYPLPTVAARQLKDHIEEASDSAHVRAVSYLASPSELPKGANWRAWERALGAESDEVVAAIAYLLGRRASEERAVRLAATAFALLYSLLANTPATHAWERLADRIGGDRGTWDRCQRLTDDFAKPIGKFSDSDATRIIGVVHHRDSGAALALTNSLTRKRSDSLRKVVSDLFRW